MLSNVTGGCGEGLGNHQRGDAMAGSQGGGFIAGSNCRGRRAARRPSQRGRAAPRNKKISAGGARGGNKAVTAGRERKKERERERETDGSSVVTAMRSASRRLTLGQGGRAQWQSPPGRARAPGPRVMRPRRGRAGAAATAGGPARRRSAPVSRRRPLGREKLGV